MLLRDFKVTPSFDAEYPRNGIRDRDTDSIEYYALLNSVISSDLD